MDEQKIAELATLPEHEWRLSMLRLFSDLQKQVDENTDMTADTQEMLNRDVVTKVDRMFTAFAAAEGGMKALETLGRIAKPVSYIAGAIGTLGAIIAGALHWGGGK